MFGIVLPYCLFTSSEKSLQVYLFPFCSSWIVWIYCNYPKNLSTKQEFHQENVPADLDETPQITKCLGKITEIMKIIWT